MQFSVQLVKGGCRREQKVVFRKDNFTSTRYTCTLTNLYLVSEAPKNHNRCAASQKSNEIHLKLDNNLLNGVSIDTSGLLATWPEFGSIGLSFSGLYSKFCIFHYLASSPSVPPFSLRAFGQNDFPLRGGGRGVPPNSAKEQIR